MSQSAQPDSRIHLRAVLPYSHSEAMARLAGVESCFGEQLRHLNVNADTSPSLGGHLILEAPEPFRATVSEWMAQSG